MSAASATFTLPKHPAPMGSFSTEKIDKSRHLLEVAERLFAQHGYEAVSIRQLAAEAGMNVAMVSYYFGSKEKLFEALIADKFPRTGERLEELARSSLSPWEKLSQTVDLYVEKCFSGRNFHRIVMREISLSQRPAHVKIITTYLSHHLQLIRGFVLEGQEKKMFRPVDVEFTLATLFGAFSALVSHGSLLCAMLHEDCADNIYSEEIQTRFKHHLKALLQAHLVVEW